MPLINIYATDSYFTCSRSPRGERGLKPKCQLPWHGLREPYAINPDRDDRNTASIVRDQRCDASRDEIQRCAIDGGRRGRNWCISVVV